MISGRLRPNPRETTKNLILIIIFMGQNLLTPILAHPQLHSLIAIAVVACLTTTSLLEVVFLMSLGVKPSGVIARLACINRPQTVCCWCRPSFILPPRPVDCLVNPIFSGEERLKENTVVSCKTRTGSSVAWIRKAEAAKCPSNILSSLTFSLAKKQ